MASNTESHKAIESSRKIKIYSFVSDHGGMYETYSCTIYDPEDHKKSIFIHVDHLKNQITLEKQDYLNVDILAVLNGDTKSLELMDIQSSEEIELGRLRRNTVVGAASYSAIMECVSLSGEAIIRDPRTNVVLAKLHSITPSDTTIVYESEAGLNTEHKILVLLLAFKIFKNSFTCPEITIPSMYYGQIDDLTNIRHISISKTSYERKGKIRCNYFEVLHTHTKQHLLTFKVCGDGSDGFRLNVFNCEGQRLFTAEPLASFNNKTEVFVNKTEIGYTKRYSLRAKSTMERTTELKADELDVPNSSDRGYKVWRKLTTQRVAAIIPDSSIFPRRVTVDIHPAVDNVSIALLLTFTMKLIVNRYHFHTDKLTEKRNLPEILTAPRVHKRFKATTSLTVKSPDDHLKAYNPVVAPINPLNLVNMGTLTSIGQSNEAQRFYPQNCPSTSTHYSGNPLSTIHRALGTQRHPNIQQPHTTHHAYEGPRYPGHQMTYTEEGTSAGQMHPDNPPMNNLHEDYANQIYQDYQSIYTEQGAYNGGQTPQNSQLSYSTQQVHGRQIYQSPYPGQGTHPEQRYQGF